MIQDILPVEYCMCPLETAFELSGKPCTHIHNHQTIHCHYHYILMPFIQMEIQMK